MEYWYLSHCHTTFDRYAKCRIKDQTLDLWFLWLRTNCPGGGGTLIFAHIRRLGPLFGVQNSEFQYFFWVFRKMNIFWGYEDFVDFFGGSSQNWASLRVISMQFRFFF